MGELEYAVETTHTAARMAANNSSKSLTETKSFWSEYVVGIAMRLVAFAVQNLPSRE